MSTDKYMAYGKIPPFAVEDRKGLNTKSDQHLIFIVEDNQVYSFMLSYRLQFNPEYMIMSFSSGGDCIKNLQLEPDVIILDYNLPAINAIDVLKKIKSFDKNIQVIFLSKHYEKDIVLNAFKEDVYDYLIKEKDSVKEADLLINKIINSIQLKKRRERNTIWKQVFIVLFSLSLIIMLGIHLLK